MEIDCANLIMKIKKKIMIIRLMSFFVLLICSSQILVDNVIKGFLVRRLV